MKTVKGNHELKVSKSLFRVKFNNSWYKIRTNRIGKYFIYVDNLKSTAIYVTD